MLFIYLVIGYNFNYVLFFFAFQNCPFLQIIELLFGTIRRIHFANAHTQWKTGKLSVESPRSKPRLVYAP